LFSASAQESQDLPPPDPEVLATQMQSLAAARAEKKKAFFRQAYAKLAGTLQQSGGAGNFVLKMVLDERFKDRKGGNAEAAKWKRDNSKLFSDRDIDTAAELSLDYLLITLKRASNDTAEPVQKEVWNHLAKLYKEADLIAGFQDDPTQVKFDVYDEKEGKVVGQMMGDIENLGGDRMTENPRQYVDQMLNNAVTDGWVAKAMGLEGHFGDLKEWERSPGNFSGIMEQDIREFLRKKKDQTLLSTWDFEINFRRLIVSKSPDEKTRLEFEQKELPRLLWRKAKDAEVLGLPNRALQMKIQVAQTYPAHTDFEDWTVEILDKAKELKEAAPAVTGNAGKGETPAASPTPTPTPAS
jgi:hypothetical protein